MTARWLRAHGYSTSLVARYVRSGWLSMLARGAYSLPRSKPTWDGVVHTLQQSEGLRLHVGGRFALGWHGHEHYLRLGAAQVVGLYGADRIPLWASRLQMEEQWLACGRGPFDPPKYSFGEATIEELYALGLERQADSSTDEVVMATVERAILELCDDKPSAALVYEVDAIMQGLSGLRPDLVSLLLRECGSVKAKRLFLALAERHEHAWLDRLALEGLDLGRGKRALVAGGRLHSKYLITLPADLGAQLG